MSEPAFPIRDSWWEGNEQRIVGYRGMALRDYFAAKAMHGMLAGCFRDGINYNDLVKESFRIADAMLKARKES